MSEVGEGAFAAVYRLYAGVCLARARSVLRDSQMAEDAVQEAFTEHWLHPERYDEAQASLRSWLVMLTHRKAVDRVRHERRRATLALSAADEVVDLSPSPHECLSRALEAAQTRRLLALLSPAQREVLVLAYWGGYTQVEIAKMTGTPLGTVKTRMRRGLLLLAAHLETSDDHALRDVVGVPSPR